MHRRSGSADAKAPLPRTCRNALNRAHHRPKLLHRFIDGYIPLRAIKRAYLCDDHLRVPWRRGNVIRPKAAISQSNACSMSFPNVRDRNTVLVTTESSDVASFLIGGHPVTSKAISTMPSKLIDLVSTHTPRDGAAFPGPHTVRQTEVGRSASTDPDAADGADVPVHQRGSGAFAQEVPRHGDHRRVR